jgi:hypothetical protein
MGQGRRGRACPGLDQHGRLPDPARAAHVALWAKRCVTMGKTRRAISRCEYVYDVKDRALKRSTGFGYRFRPVVLFGETAAERARETGASERTLHHKADQFDQQGMASLFYKEGTPSPDKARALPPDRKKSSEEMRQTLSLTHLPFCIWSPRLLMSRTHSTWSKRPTFKAAPSRISRFHESENVLRQ